MMQKCKDTGEKSPVFVFDLLQKSSSEKISSVESGIIDAWKGENLPNSFRFP